MRPLGRSHRHEAAGIYMIALARADERLVTSQRVDSHDSTVVDRGTGRVDCIRVPDQQIPVAISRNPDGPDQVASFGDHGLRAALQVDVENFVRYVEDVTDPSQFATRAAVTPAVVPRNFVEFVAIADIVAVNGQPVTCEPGEIIVPAEGGGFECVGID